MGASSTALAICTLSGCSAEGGTDAPAAGGDGASSGGSGAARGGSSNGGSSGDAGGGGTSGSSGGFECETEDEPGELVEIPAGEFLMGCNEEVDDECLDDEMPMLVVELDAFEIDRTEVTQGQYTACVNADACEPPSCEWDCDATDLPATCVRFPDALDYCAWAGKRLPTEAEWEKAARGSDGLKFPWGNQDPDCTLVNMVGCGDVATPVGSFPDGASPFGLLDMAGNMVEMIADWYDPAYYQRAPTTNPTGPESGTRFGGRGGGFKSEATWHRASKRDWYVATDAGASLGFRCAR